MICGSALLFGRQDGDLANHAERDARYVVAVARVDLHVAVIFHRDRDCFARLGDEVTDALANGEREVGAAVLPALMQNGVKPFYENDGPLLELGDSCAPGNGPSSRSRSVGIRRLHCRRRRMCSRFHGSPPSG